MEMDVNGVRVQFYLDTGTEVNIVNKETLDYIGAPGLQKCDEVARMYNGQTATFLGKGRAVIKRRDHATEDVFYIATRGSLNLLSYPTMQRLGLYIADTYAINAISTKHPSTSDVKIVASLKNSFPSVFKDGFGTCTVTKSTLTLKTPRQACALRLYTDCRARG